MRFVVGVAGIEDAEAVFDSEKGRIVALIRDEGAYEGDGCLLVTIGEGGVETAFQGKGARELYVAMCGDARSVDCRVFLDEASESYSMMR